MCPLNFSPLAQRVAEIRASKDQGQNANSQSLTPRPGVRVGSWAAKLGTCTVPIGVYLCDKVELSSPYSLGDIFVFIILNPNEHPVCLLLMTLCGFGSGNN